MLGQQGFVRLPTILKLIPVGRSTWWAGVKSGRFPKGVKLGRNTTAWRVEDIKKLMESFEDEKDVQFKTVVRSSVSASLCPFELQRQK